MKRITPLMVISVTDPKISMIFLVTTLFSKKLSRCPYYYLLILIIIIYIKYLSWADTGHLTSQKVSSRCPLGYPRM